MLRIDDNYYISAIYTKSLDLHRRQEDVWSNNRNGEDDIDEDGLYEIERKKCREEAD